MNITLADSHAHLCDTAFDPDRAAVIERAFTLGVNLIMETPCVPADWEPALALCARYPGKIYAVCGIHPQDCDKVTPENLARLRELLTRPAVRGLGEIGLDYAHYSEGFARQAEALTTIFRHTADLKKSIVLHCRNPFAGTAEHNAYRDMFAVMKKNWTPHFSGRFSGVLHCFSGDETDLKTALGMGLAIGVNGTLSYKKNGALRALVKSAGLKNILFETDCPYLPPQSCRGKRNDPSKIPEICAHAAELFDVAPQAAAAAALANTREVFGLPA